MDAKLVREYRARWKAVREVELEEQRQASLPVRWQQLNALYAIARSLGFPSPTKEAENEAVRQRWESLKDRS